MAKQIRVKVFKNAEELLNLAEMVFKKHQELQVDSPLKPLGWDTEGAKVAQAIELHKKAKEYARLAEQAHEQRNALLEPIDTMVKQSRDLLKAIYKKEPRKLGEFGFTVDDTPRTKKTKPEEPKA